MTKNEIVLAIKNYCDERKLAKTAKIINAEDGNRSHQLMNIFIRYNEKRLKTERKLSFSYKVTSSQNILRKRLSDINVESVKKSKINKKAKINKIKLEKTEPGEKIPESFLLLMDELCIGRKEARKFFQNPDAWTYIKSDRKIFCTKKGTLLFI